MISLCKEKKIVDFIAIGGISFGDSDTKKHNRNYFLKFFLHVFLWGISFILMIPAVYSCTGHHKSDRTCAGQQRTN